MLARTIFLFYLLSSSLCLKAQHSAKPHTDYYIDSSGNRIPCSIRFKGWTSVQDSVVLLDNTDTRRVFRPSEILGFGLTVDDTALSYRAVSLINERLFLSLSVDGPVIQEYPVYRLRPFGKARAYTDFVLCRNGHFALETNGDPHITSAFFSDYPLLATMLYYEACDFAGKENADIINEYNRWEAIPGGGNARDTAMALRGIIDANRRYSATVPFLVGFVSGSAGFIFGGIAYCSYVSANRPKIARLGIRDKNLANDSLYVHAYQSRAHTSKLKAAYAGAILGMLADFGFYAILHNNIK
jgi:hypothetical protein